MPEQFKKLEEKFNEQLEELISVSTLSFKDSFDNQILDMILEKYYKEDK